MNIWHIDIYIHCRYPSTVIEYALPWLKCNYQSKVTKAIAFYMYVCAHVPV